jgi:hypothetical protein
MSWWNPASWVKSNDGRTVADITADDARTQQRIDELNNRAAANYGPLWEEQVAKNQRAQAVDDAAIRDSLDETFAPAQLVKNLGESAASVSAPARDFLGTVLSFPLKVIPPVGWLLIGVGLFVYVGGPAYVRRVVAKKG